MKEIRSVNSPLDWENGKNNGSFVRIRIASSADIVPQKWQTKTEIMPPLLFLSSERWICDWSNGDFENGKFSIDDSESYSLSLKFLSRTAPIDFQTWYESTLKKQQVCLEITDENENERVFSPFDVTYKFQQQSTNGEMTEYELLFMRSKVIVQKDRIISVQTNCDTHITKLVFASGKPELYTIIAVQGNKLFGGLCAGDVGITNIPDGQYTAYAIKNNFLGIKKIFNVSPRFGTTVKDITDLSKFLSSTFEVKCEVCGLSITAIEEVFDCRLSIKAIEEVTQLNGNSGKLVTGLNTQSINNINDVCSASINPNRVEIDIYFYGSPKLGMVLFTDESKTTRKNAGIYGLKYNSKIYKVKTDSTGTVVEFDGECVASTLPKRFIAYQILNAWEIDNGNVGLIKEQIDDMVNAGANFLALSINMEGVFKSNADLVANSPTKWTNYDAVFQHAATKNIPVGIRVNLGTDDQYISNYWGWENQQKDEWGYDCTVYYGGGHCSFSFAPGVAMMLDFVTKVTARYFSVFGGNLHFIQPTTTEQDEYGGNFQNQQWPSPIYAAMYDYNPMNQNAFKAAMQAQYQTIENLKSAWGLVSFGWNNFDEIQLPKTGLTNRQQSTITDIRAGMEGKRGEDWVKFNTNQYMDFAVSCKNAIKNINQNINLSLNFGSGNDELSLVRYSYNLKAWFRIVDLLQIDFTTRNPTNTKDYMSADWVNSMSDKPKFSEIADFDSGNYEAALAYARSGLDNGLAFISIISHKYNLENWEKYLLLVKTLIAEYANKPITLRPIEGTINVSWSECIHNWPSVEERWRNAGGSSTKRILINFTEDL